MPSSSDLSQSSNQNQNPNPLLDMDVHSVSNPRTHIQFPSWYLHIYLWISILKKPDKIIASHSNHQISQSIASTSTSASLWQILISIYSPHTVDLPTIFTTCTQTYLSLLVACSLVRRTFIHTFQYLGYLVNVRCHHHRQSSRDYFCCLSLYPVVPF